MRHARATLAVAIITLLAGASAVHAEPVDVRVRIEGVTSTIVDRVVRTDGHAVKATSDSLARHCDGTNAGRALVPGPTATAAASDALATLGQDFDGQWYPGLDDYFITRLGAEHEDNNALWWWGILVNRVVSPLGGCQRQVHAGDEVLWVNDAFSNRPFLWLDGPASAQLGIPLVATVTATTGNGPTTGPPYAGAVVSAVDANGRPTAAGTADGAASGADGTAAVTFHALGWQRLKARATGPYPAAIASNSIDVCVEASPGDGCAGTPPVTTFPDPPAPPGGGGGGDARRYKAPKAAVPAWTRGFASGTLRDDRARGLRWRGAWLRTVTADAWRGTLTRGAAGASLALELGAGRPAFALRSAGARARVEVRAAGQARTFTLASSRVPRIQRLVGPRRTRPGRVALRVLSGAVLIDGVGRAR